MKINYKTWPKIEAKLDKTYGKKKEIKQQKSKILGQKPNNWTKS